MDKMNFELIKKIIGNISRVIVGKKEAIELLLVTLLADGHALLEDVPGVGKTLIAKSLAKSIKGSFNRIQFTPDLLPSDITGFNIYNQKERKFEFKQGPVLTNVLLADEINRAIPRTQSSLLESMEERQVTIDGKTYPLPKPFFLIATQNPIELEGTFPLPEAQLDRFLIKINIGYPNEEEEISILKRFQKDDPLISLKPVATPKQIITMKQMCKKITLSSSVHKYIIDIISSTRNNKKLRFGVSPRGSLGLMRAAQGLAAIKGRNYVIPDDVKELIKPVLAHRIILNEEEKLRGETPENILEEIISQTPVPD